MYVGTTSLTKLAAFLTGFDCAQMKLAPYEKDHFLSEFRDWVYKRFNTSKQSWEDVILGHSNDEADAVERFWKLLDEYVAVATSAPSFPKDASANVDQGRAAIS